VKYTTATFPITDNNIFKNKMLNWANRFNIFCFLDNHGYSADTAAFDCILAAGCNRSIALQQGNAFNSLKDFYDLQPGWLFGHLGYDLKNEVESLASSKPALVDFGAGFFFEPEVVLRLHNNTLSITSSSQNTAGIFTELDSQPETIDATMPTHVTVQAGMSKEKYIAAINALRQHIIKGDCYEINYCQQFSALNAVINPLYTYSRLVNVSPNPFAALYKLNDKYCICASPERYLKKSGSRLVSQPIKGTIKRNKENAQADDANKKHLFESSKERSENVMVVDLVRNDLSKICKEGTVEVQELFGIYTFPHLHQMISTIKGAIADGLHWTDAVKATFPMGSMTGAPKKRVMELIDEYETTARGLFSGAIGYVTPHADFDFNVVIRSIFYDAANKKLSFSAGGGITFNSNAQEEYNESMLKAEAIVKVLNEA
jgi:para-aminobenzoate synthetase component I